MNRQKSFFIFSREDLDTIKVKVLLYIAKSDTFTFLDNNQYVIAPNRYELLAGTGCRAGHTYQDLNLVRDWIFGNLRFEFDPKVTDKEVPAHHPGCFYTPDIVIYIPAGQDFLVVEAYSDPDSILQDIIAIPDKETHLEYVMPLSAHILSSIDQETYIDRIEQIREDIFQGKYYELNYCIPFYVRDITIDPVVLFYQQNRLNPAPMAALHKYKNEYLVCTSPERFIFKNKQMILSQPIKGTAPRGNTPQEQAENKAALSHSEKDKSENVMIVDLTRNDLAKCCETASVTVPELFGIYEFPFVYQMISTIQGTLKGGMHFQDVLQCTFPMGSMTGAPKATVIDHIRKYEPEARGLYSGTVFYINPDGDYDSNVVIRSIVYCPREKSLSFKVGGAITYDSTALQEWEEIQWKAASMKRAILPGS